MADAKGEKRSKIAGLMGAAERCGLSNAKAGEVLKKLA